MEVLNPTTKAIKEHNEKSQIFISFRRNGTALGISKAAMARFLLKPGMRLTFVIDIDRLYFYISKEEGFVIVNARHESGSIFSKMLVRYIYERLPASKRNGTKYTVRVSNTRINDSATFEILLHEKV